MSAGSRNPPWDRDETLLAMNLYLQCNGKVPDKTDERVRQLSELLRRNPVHARYRARENFRSPSAVVLKLSNIQQAAEGHGMPNNSRLDEEMWSELGKDPSTVFNLANLVADAMASSVGEVDLDTDDEFIFQEGRLLTRQHQVRERNPGLRLKVLRAREKSGSLRCEICELSHDLLPLTLRRAAFEVHHLLPLAVSGQRAVRMKDVALLCASCHRLIHHLISDRRRWMTLEEAKVALVKDQM